MTTKPACFLLALAMAASGCATIESIARGGNPQAGSVFVPDYTFCGTRSLIEHHPGVCPEIYKTTTHVMTEAPLLIPIAGPIALVQLIPAMAADAAFLPFALAPRLLVEFGPIPRRQRREDEERSAKKGRIMIE